MIIKTTILISTILATSVGIAHADGGNHNGNNNSGVLTGNMNGALSGNNMTSRSASRATARNTATQSYEGYNGLDNSGNSNNSNTFKERLQAPGIAAPGLTSGGNTCAGSYGLGFSVPGFGLSGGKTYSMRECEARATSELLSRYGLRRIAVQVLYDEHPMVRRAMDIQRNAKKR